MRLFEAYRKSVIQLDQFQREVEKISPEKTQLETKLKELQENQDISQPVKIVEKGVWEYCRIIKRKLKDFTFEQQQAFLRLLLENVVINDGTVRIKGIIPAYNPEECDLYTLSTKDKDAIVLTDIYQRGHNATFRFELVEKIR